MPPVACCQLCGWPQPFVRLRSDAGWTNASYHLYSDYSVVAVTTGPAAGACPRRECRRREDESDENNLTFIQAREVGDWPLSAPWRGDRPLGASRAGPRGWNACCPGRSIWIRWFARHAERC